MWKRRRTWILLVAVTAVALAVYFEPTHCVRGWLWGEAFYDGRPTSWWRESIHQWKDRFYSEEDAFRWQRGEGVMFRPRSTVLLDRMRDWIRSDDDRLRDHDPPKVLAGSRDAEPVLRELELDPAFRRFVEQARIIAATE